MMIHDCPVASLVAGGGLIYLVYLVFKFRDRAIGTKKRNDPQFRELGGWPLLGQLLTPITLEYTTAQAFKYGPGFSFTVPGFRIIDISKPEWIEHVQKTNFNNYVKGTMFQSIMYDVFGTGIFVADGAMWKRTRQATSSIFTINTFRNIITPASQKSIEGLIQELQSAADERRSMDFCHLFFRFTLDSFVQMTFSKDLNLLGCQNEIKPQPGTPARAVNPGRSFAAAFDFAQNQLDFRFDMLIGWKVVEALNFSMGTSMKASCRILDDFAYSLIDERLSHLANKSIESKDEQSAHRDLLDLFMAARDDRGGGLGRTELRDTAMNLIIAGRDTTAQALSWAFFHLLMNKDIVSKIHHEITEVLGDEECYEKGVTYDNHKRFTWAYSVVLETLRLHPSVPKNAKSALTRDHIPGGPIIEAGDIVRWSDWQMGRDPSIWGPDCGEFKPDRWIDETVGIRQLGQFKFHAFNGGPRVCLGRNLAMFQAVKVIVEILQRFDLEFAEGWLENVPKIEKLEGFTSRYPTPKYRPSLTLFMDNPMMIKIQSRHH